MTAIMFRQLSENDICLIQPVKSLTFLKVNMSRFENMIQSLDLVT